MYRSTSDPTVNMEYLFAMSDPDSGGDPLETSLFNLDTLMTLVNLGNTTPNILTNKDVTYKTDFTLQQGWTDLAARLKLDDPGSQDDVGTKRAYMLWLWMRTAWERTFERTQDVGGSF